MQSLDNNTQAFLALVRAGLWEQDVRLLPYQDMKWQEVYRLATEQSVLGLVLAGLEHSDVKAPLDLLLQWIGEVQMIEQQNKAMNQFIALLIEKLRKEDVYAILVKGQGVAQCYERPFWRVSGDVDLYLSDDNYDKAKAFLSPLASEIEKEYVRERHLGMTINGWVVELHGSLYCGLSSRIEHELDKVHQDTFFCGSVGTWDDDGTQVFLLKAENDVFYVFTHILQHFYKEGVGLRQVCDWCRLLWTHKDSLNCELLESQVKQAGLMSEWKAFYCLASKYLGMPDLDLRFMFHDSRYDKKADWIMEFVLKSGNMGHNRDMGHFSKYPYLIRKCVSMGRRIGDLINHARIFPLDSLRFFPYMVLNGLRSAIRGE